MTETSGTPDSDLIRQFVEKNDEQAFKRLVVLYQDRVYNYCLRFLGKTEDAEDCAQEVYIRVFRHLAGFRNDAAFSSWLFRIMFNVCTEYVRSKTYRQGLKNTRIELYNTHADLNHSGNPQADELIHRKEINTAFQKALMKLNSRYRKLIILRDIEANSYDEIVKITGIKEGSVKSGLARARAKMAKELSEYKYAI